MFELFGIFGKKDSASKSEPQSKVVEPRDIENIDVLAELFKSITGVSFESQKGILKSKLSTFCRNRCIDSLGSLLHALGSESVLKQELIDYLTTNESFFYREFGQIERLVSAIKESDEEVDILCAPCATGEEPYSIIIALLEAGLESDKFRVVGIDINQSAIDRAIVGVYGKRSVKNLTDKILANYFTEKDGRYYIRELIKQKASFRRINIFENELYSLGKFDYIFSRNMLIYFDKETKLKAKSRLESLLKTPANPIFFGHADLF